MNINKLNKPQALSVMMQDNAQIFFGSVIVGPIVSGTINWSLVVIGLLASVMSWSAGLYLSKE